MSLASLARATHEDCQPIDETWLTHWLVLTWYASYGVTLTLIGFGFQRRELYMTLFGLLLAFDSLVNWLLQQAIRDPVPVPGCGGPFGMPSFQVQHNACFTTFILMYGMIWPSGRHGHVLYTAALVAWQAVVAYAHVLLNYNTPRQVVVAAAVGATVAWLGQMAIYAIVWPRFPRILTWSIIRWRGYTDTLCCYCTSDITPPATDKESNEELRVAPPPGEPPLQ